MWIQLERNQVDQLGALADKVGMRDVSKRLRDAIDVYDSNTTDEYRSRAKETIAKEGDLEVDDDASVSVGDDDGAYVMAWQWIPGAASEIQADAGSSD
jgi:hypothetical protein